MTEVKESVDISKGKKEKKKIHKAVDALTSALKALPPEQQVITLLEKYAELLSENCKLQNSLKTAERIASTAEKEKEQVVSEHSKVVLSKSKLESLCRELQRLNKAIKDENMSRLREEEEKRKEVSQKFNTTLSEISALMQENSDKNVKLRSENQEMGNRLQDLIKQYESREEHISHILKQKDLQVELANAKLAKANVDFAEAKEKILSEKKDLLESLSEHQHKITKLSMTEINLRTQLNSYIQKYEEFQETVTKSNELLHTFKKEMEEMSKRIRKLEKETKSWRERWESANRNLLEMVSERSGLQQLLETEKRQNKQLSSLCRALQQELTETRNQLKVFNATARPALPGVHSSTEPVSPDSCQIVPSPALINIGENCDDENPFEGQGSDNETDEVRVVGVEEPSLDGVDRPCKEAAATGDLEDVYREVDSMIERNMESFSTACDELSSLKEANCLLLSEFETKVNVEETDELGYSEEGQFASDHREEDCGTVSEVPVASKTLNSLELEGFRQTENGNNADDYDGSIKLSMPEVERACEGVETPTLRDSLLQDGKQSQEIEKS